MIQTSFPGNTGNVKQVQLGSGDLLEYARSVKENFAVVFTDRKAANTPYKEGLTGDSTAGVSLIATTGNGLYITILYFTVGWAEKMLVTHCADGTWSNWRIVTTQAAAADEPGDDNEAI